jgi:putative transposase
MPCPHCCSAKTTERSDRTAHGYRRFRCRGCGRGFNERTGSVLNRLQLPTDVVFLIVLWRLRMKLSLRDLTEILLLRGLVFSHEAIRDWEAKLAPLLTDALRQRRKGKAGRSWYVDESVPRTHWQRWQCGAAHEMRGGPSEPAVRGRLQTASSCIGQEPVW